MFDWLLPQTIETKGSKKVVKDKGKFIIYVDGIQQSGPWVQKIWSKVPLIGQNILVLGLGCGTLINLLPKTAKVTGVEIDSEMIDLGKKYFGLKDINILNEDASIYIRETKDIYDLILVDLYVGINFPKQFESSEFLQKLAQTVSTNGTVIFNTLTTKTANFELDKFIDKLEEYFKIQKTVKVDFNTLVICSRGEKR